MNVWQALIVIVLIILVWAVTGIEMSNRELPVGPWNALWFGALGALVATVLKEVQL